MGRTLSSRGYHVPLSGFTPAVHVAAGGGPAFVSALDARDESGELVGVADVAAQTRQVVRNLRASLATVGLDTDAVVRIRSYVLRIDDWHVLRPALREVWGAAMPASTAVQVPRLRHDEALIEIEAVAWQVPARPRA